MLSNKALKITHFIRWDGVPPPLSLIVRPHPQAKEIQMLGFNNKSASVLWRNAHFNRIAVVQIREQRTVFAVINVPTHVTSMSGEFTLDCVHALDRTAGTTVPCQVLAKSYSESAMRLVAEQISECFDTSRNGYRDKPA